MSHVDATQRPSAIARFFRNPKTGELAVIQLPNLPLSLWLAATLARLVFSLHGTAAQVVSVVGTLSLAVWSLLELVRGDSPFRRVLGGLVALGIVVSLLSR